MNKGEGKGGKGGRGKNVEVREKWMGMGQWDKRRGREGKVNCDSLKGSHSTMLASPSLTSNKIWDELEYGTLINNRAGHSLSYLQVTSGVEVSHLAPLVLHG